MYGEYDPDLYCKLFVDADDLTQAELQSQLVRCLGNLATSVTSVGQRSVDGLNFAIDVMRNEDFNATRRKEPDGFLYFRYYLDVDAVPRQPRAAQVALVAQILQCLWAQGWAAVAACDFEDALPHRGGYNPAR